MLSFMLGKRKEKSIQSPKAVGVLPVWPQELKCGGHLISEHNRFDGYHCHSVLYYIQYKIVV